MEIRVHYNQEDNTSEARDKHGMCVAFYDFNSDELEQYDDFNGLTIEELIQMMYNERESLKLCPTDEEDQKY